MTAKDRFIIAAAFVLPAVMGLRAAGEICVSGAAAQTAFAEETQMLEINSTNDGIIKEDLLDCRLMLRKTPAEAGIPETVISRSAVFTKTYADGKAFDRTEYGVIYFSENGSIDRIWLHIKETGFEECRRLLAERFGEPSSEGEHPYVLANGGAVRWAEFGDGDTAIKLSHASERSYCEIEFTKTGE